MISSLINSAQANPCLLQELSIHDANENKLVNVHFQENNYQALLQHIKRGSDQGWILFLAPPGKPSSEFFQKAGIDKSRVLMIDSNKVKDNLSLLSTLLKSDNYCTVVTWVNDLSTEALTTIKQDAQLTNTSCFVYCKQ